VNLQEIVEGLPPTALAYLKEPYAAEAPGVVVKVAKEQGSSYYLVLASTIFHPKGGGQPSDTGTVSGGDYTLQVKKALKSGDHVVLYGKASGVPVEGPCTQEIDWGQRFLYMRRHAAAHLFDGVLAKTSGRVYEPLDSWLGDDAYVAYLGEPPADSVVSLAETEANNAIREARDLTAQVVSAQELSGLRNFWSSVLQGKEEVRLVRIDGFEPIPCAGTHVRNLREVVGVKVTTTERTADGFKIHFDVLA